MAGKFKLNTGGITNLKQLICGVPSGNVYDHLAQNAAGTVTLSDERDMAAVRKIEKGGVPILTET